MVGAGTDGSVQVLVWKRPTAIGLAIAGVHVSRSLALRIVTQVPSAGGLQTIGVPSLLLVGIDHDLLPTQ